MLALDLHVDGREARQVIVSQATPDTRAVTFHAYSLLYETGFAIAFTNTTNIGSTFVIGLDGRRNSVSGQSAVRS